MTGGLIDDIETGRLVQDFLRRSFLARLERDLFPWRFPDPNPFPEFILFPRLTRLERKMKR